MGAGDGAVARHRGRLRHPRRCSTWYERFARGRPGGLVVEATGIRDVPSGPLLRVGHDRFVPRPRGARRGRAARKRRAYPALPPDHRLPGDQAPSREGGLLPAVLHRHRPPHERRSRRTGSHGRAVQGASGHAADEALDRILTPRELEALRFGYRERVTDTAPAAHSRSAAGPARPVRRRPRAARARRASTASSCTTRTPTRWRPSSRRSTRATTATAAGASIAHACRSRCIRAVREAVGRDFVVGVPVPHRRLRPGRQHRRRREFFGVAFARAGFDFLSLSRGGKFEDAKQPKVGWAVYPYTGPSGWECMPTTLGDARGPVRAQRRSRPRGSGGPCARRASTRRSSLPGASAPSIRPKGSSLAAKPTSSGRRGSRLPIRTGS